MNSSGEILTSTSKTLKKKKATKAVDEDNEKNPTTKRKNSVFSRPKFLSPALAEFLGAEKMSRGDVVKQLHAYFKEHSLQNPKDKRKILFDEKLQIVFKRKSTDYFKLNRLLSSHLYEIDEV